jgi:hypothetical protein
MGQSTKEKYTWDEIFETVRLCRKTAGDTEPTRLAVEDVMGGGDGNRIQVAIRAVEAEYGYRPEFLDDLPAKLKRFVSDPRTGSGRLPIPAELTDLGDPFLSALITIASATKQRLTDGATDAGVLVADKAREADQLVADAQAAVADHAATIAIRDTTITDLTKKLAAATRRADKAEAALEAYRQANRGVGKMQAQLGDVHAAVVTSRRRVSRTTRR